MDWVEGAVLSVSAPLLVFPTVRPRWTVVALVALAAVWLLRWALRREPWPLTPFNGALLLFALMIPVAIRVSVAPEFSYPDGIRLVLGLAVFRYIGFLARTRRRLIWASIVFCLAGLLATGIGVIAVQWPEKAAFLSPLTEHLPRLIALFPEDQGPPGVHPNQLAAILMIFLPLAVTLTMCWPYDGRSTWRKVPLLVTVAVWGALTGSTLLLTQSRSGWIGGWAGIAAALALLGSTLPRSWRKWTVWGTCAVLIILPLGWIVHIGPEGISHLWENPADETAVGSLNTLVFRQEVWRWALVGVRDFPFTGCGLGAFRRVARILYPLDPLKVSPNYDIGHAHNIFLQTALDLGIPGLVAYVALLLVAGAACWNVARQGDPLTRPLAIGLAAGLLALHTYGMTDAMALGSKLAVVFWFALGLIAGICPHSAVHSPQSAVISP